MDEKVWPRVSRFKRVVEGEGESVKVLLGVGMLKQVEQLRGSVTRSLKLVNAC